MKEFELEPGEKVVVEVRKHWIILALQMVPFIGLAAAGIVVYSFFLSPSYPSVCAACIGTPPSAETIKLLHVLLGLWLLMLWTGAWLTFTRYYLNLWVVTNERIVDITQRGFFRRKVSSLLLTRVQDITVNTEGILVSLLDIGDINLQSAGAEERFCMKGIPHPAVLRDEILKYIPNVNSPGVE